MLQTHTVTDLDSLQRVRSLRRGSRVVLNLPALPDEESSKLQAHLNRCISECGCSVGARALIASVAACILFDSLYWSAFCAHILKALGINLLLCFVAAGLGRTLGRYRAKLQVARTVQDICVRLSASVHA